MKSTTSNISFLKRAVLWFANPFVYKVLIWLLKSALLVFTGVYFYLHIFKNPEFYNIGSHIIRLVSSFGSLLILFSVLLLFIVNWGLEAIKWRFLVARFSKLSLKQAFAAVFSGTTISLWTPNRSGEFLGRIVYLPQGCRVNGALATFIGSISQIMVTIIMGMAGSLYYFYTSADRVIFWVVVPELMVIFTALALFCYFNLNRIYSLIPSIGIIRKIRKYLLIYKYYRRADLFKVLQISFFRYLTYSFQFLLLLYFFEVDISVFVAIPAIFFSFLVQMAVPGNNLTELSVRGASSYFLFEQLTSDVTLVVAASYSLWLINVILPGVFGIIALTIVRIRNRRSV